MPQFKKRIPFRVGQALVELALVGSTLILLIMGALVFGQLFSWLHTLNNAAREGARAGAICKSDEEIIAIVKDLTNHLPNAESITVTIDPSGERRTGEPITVTVTYDAPVVPIPGILSRPKRLTVRATYRMECAIEEEEEDAGTRDGATCDVTCAGRWTCDATCSGRPTCRWTCRGRPTCRRTCRGRVTCRWTCQGRPTCRRTCRGRVTCRWTCRGRPTCRRTCRGRVTCRWTCRGRRTCSHPWCR